MTDDHAATINIDEKHHFVGKAIPVSLLYKTRATTIDGSWNLISGTEDQKPSIVLTVDKVDGKMLANYLTLTPFLEDEQTLVFQQGDVDSASSSITIVFHKTLKVGNH